MNKTLCLSLCLLAGAATLSAQQRSAVDQVNPIIGTNKMGHVFPGACVPHGIVALSPDTDTIPHNINGVYQPRAYEYCADTSTKIRRSSASATPTSAAPATPIWATS